MFGFPKRRRPHVAQLHAQAPAATPARLERLETRTMMCQIGDRVWLDANCDGIQGGGEAGIPGVQVDLYQIDPVTGNATWLNGTTTDASGNYLFSRTSTGGSLDLGTFEVRVTIPDGYHAAPKDVGSDNAVDSDINASGSTGPFVLGNANIFDLTWDAGLCVDEPPPPPPPPPPREGRMTGGGSVFLQAGMVGGPVGTRVTHGFEIHCNIEANNRLEINWGKPNNHFHLADLTAVECLDTPIIQNPPDAPIDTFIATGVGRFSGNFGGTKYAKAPATVEFVFRDGGPTKGEPGIYDVASYKITLDGSGIVVLNTDGTDADSVPDELLLDRGNHQAHYELKRLTTAASQLQADINSVFDQLDSTTLSEARTASLTQQLLDLQAQFETANA
jgi:hypothetical protein